MANMITLKLNKEFKRAYFQGKFKSHPLLTSYIVRSKRRGIRYGITVSKKQGCAVKRNRARRIIRHAFFELQREGVLSGVNCDVVFVARKDTVFSTMPKVKAVMKKQLEILLKR